MLTSHTYLVSVNYNQEKNQILCEFKNKNYTQRKNFIFYPYLKIKTNEKLTKNTFENLLNEFKLNNILLETENDYLKIKAKHIDELKKLNNLFSKTINKQYLILEPERIFLIEKNWSYFDEFKINDNEINKIEENLELNNKDKYIDFEKTVFQNVSFNQAIKINEKDTIEIIKKAILSKILKIAPYRISQNKQEIIESYLENIFFEHGQSLEKTNEKLNFLTKEYIPFNILDSFSQIDFGATISKLISKNFYNIGFDTLNCNCCKPNKMTDKNILPSTKIEVSFNENNFYYETKSKLFADKFHKEHENKKDRELRKFTNFSNKYPIGPIKLNEKIKIPLIDAQILYLDEKIKIEKNHELFWFCQKKESFLSISLNKKNDFLFELFNKKNKLNENQTNTLIYTKTFEKEYFNIYYQKYKEILNEIPFHLTNQLSKFFSSELAKAILSIQEETINEFKEFSEKKGYRTYYSGKKVIYLEGSNPLKIIKDFLTKYNLNPPEIIKICTRNQ
ncbi:MAG: hypothetical protein PHQ98_00475 [Candidatus ainarchaeum sp.]|nr:hypothetical protein [Candidatus ainarchaeum sp.]